MADYWTIAYTLPRNEVKAQANLERQGFTCYLPVMAVKRKRKAPVKPELVFPRYIFIRVEGHWRSVQGTVGVARILLAGREQPAKIPDAWVNTLRAQERNGVIVLPNERYRLGQRVTVNTGQFAGISGLYQGMTSRQREVVLLDVLGRVELAAGDLI